MHRHASENVLFVYGTLIDPDVQRAVIGRKVELEAQAVRGYSKRRIILDGKSYPILVPTSEAVTEGFVMRLTTMELAQVDAYESEAYRRTRLTLLDHRDAWAYVAP